MEPLSAAGAAAWGGKLWRLVGGGIIDTLLGPSRIRREGRAATTVKVEERLALAQADLYVKQMNEGKKSFSLNEFRLISHDISGSYAEHRPQAEQKPLVEGGADVTSALVAEKIQKEVNVAKAALYAEEVLEKGAAPPAEEPSSTWLARWRQSVEVVQDDELHELWGRILAGELQAPGSFSLRTLELVRNLSKEEAELISRAAVYRVHDFMYRPTDDDGFFQRKGLSFGDLLELQELGILSGVEALGITKTFTPDSDGRLCRDYVLNNHVLRVDLLTVDGPITGHIYKFTSRGMEVASLAAVDDDLEYLAAIKSSLFNRAGKVAVHRIGKRLAPGQVKYLAEEVELPAWVPAPSDPASVLDATPPD